MEVIVPAAGLSTRFPNVKPKYLHYAYDHKMMLVKAVEKYIGKHNITVVILQEHVDKYNAMDFVKNELPNARIIVLDKPTKGPAETVYMALKEIGNHNFDFLVKDCDSFFTHDVPSHNFVCVSRIDVHKTLRNLSAKSFVKYNNQNIITDIIEKKVVSDSFCVGAYKFNSSKKYRENFEKIDNTNSEIFVSHIISQLLDQEEVFIRQEVTDYYDVGTADDWHEYNNKPVIFCDIDGTIIKAQGRYGKYTFNDPPIVLENNVRTIKKYQENGSMIIFTTSRPKDSEEQTKSMLKDLGFTDFQLITGLHNSSRILINDYNAANPFPRAIAVNLVRDFDNLKDYL